MQQHEHTTIYRKDFTPPSFLVEKTNLLFVLEEDKTRVTSTVSYYRNEKTTEESILELDGEEMELVSITLDGKPLCETEYETSSKGMSIRNLPQKFTLEITTDIYPDKNTSLEGLYRSNGNYCTQCEAEGFRKITYYLDRPCVLAPFTTRIEGHRSRVPVMLSNGNKIEEGQLEDDHHYAVWNDPHPKPSYLFALVAGDLVAIEESYTTTSGREVALKIFVEHRNKNKCGHAMTSLKKSMKWDEDVFGLEYDLDIFMLVAVDDFNMGAMENKGLNVFNSKYVLALPETATDRDYLGIEGVIGHEYFHNWTGNRVTCRDWFQLSLKEGLTVFRDQEFSSDLNSRAVQRIDDVKILRDYQFKEDASAMAHSVRPDSYVEINNFYTSTVYNKGAEVIRMIHTLLGADGFRKGMDLYFKRHDGQAVTCDDFVAAMEDATDIPLNQFRLWYSQAGTPRVDVSEEWNAEKNQYTLTLRQSCPATPHQSEKESFHIPVNMGLVGENGEDLLEEGSRVLQFTNAEQVFVFDNIFTRPKSSLFRGFSAPVLVSPYQSRDDLISLMATDSDLFNRWDASQKLFLELILETITDLQKGKTPALDPAFKEAVRSALIKNDDPALLAQAIVLPQERYLAAQMSVVDVENIHKGRLFVKKELALYCEKEMRDLYESLGSSDEYALDPSAMGKRALRNTLLSYLMVAGETEGAKLCLKQYETSTNMTDSIAALVAVSETESIEKTKIFDAFYQKWKTDPLVMDKWLSIQAISSADTTLNRIHELLAVPEFSMNNPNKVRALIGAFASSNHYRFHDITGAGYTFVAEKIVALNALNPQIAARLVSSFSSWKNYDEKRQNLMKQSLDFILKAEDLSKDVYEVASKIRKG